MTSLELNENVVQERAALHRGWVCSSHPDILGLTPHLPVKKLNLRNEKISVNSVPVISKFVRMKKGKNRSNSWPPFEAEFV